MGRDSILSLLFPQDEFVLKFFSSIVRYTHNMVGSEKNAVISIVGVFFVFFLSIIVYAEHVSRV